VAIIVKIEKIITITQWFHSIAMKFGRMALMPTLNPIGAWKFELVKNQDGRRL